MGLRCFRSDLGFQTDYAVKPPNPWRAKERPGPQSAGVLQTGRSASRGHVPDATTFKPKMTLSSFVALGPKPVAS